MLISVLVPIYKVEKYIERCTRSIFEQTYENLDVVFVDDCSPDHSVEILKKNLKLYPKRIAQTRIISHECNKGLAAARNTAILNARGEYVFHLDGDDFLDIHAIEYFAEEACNTNADIIFSNFILEEASGVIKFTETPCRDKEVLLKNIILKKHSCQIWNKLFRKKLYSENCIIVPIGINNGEDYITLPRLLYYAKQISFINAYTYYYNRTNINSFQYNIGCKKNLADGIPGNRFLADFFRNQDVCFVKYVDAMLLDIRVTHLLWATELNDIKIERKNQMYLQYKYVRYLKKKYILVPILFLDFIHADTLILWISKKFQKRKRLKKVKICIK